jgi:hypothetical protein
METQLLYYSHDQVRKIIISYWTNETKLFKALVCFQLQGYVMTVVWHYNKGSWVGSESGRFSVLATCVITNLSQVLNKY